MKSKLIIILVLITILGCNLLGEPAPFPYDETINIKRKEVGLRIIDSCFNPFLDGSTYNKFDKRYYSPKLKLKKNNSIDTLKTSAYWSKHIHLDKNTGKVLAEDDIFRSGKYKSDADMTYFESLILRYVFVDGFHHIFETNSSSKDENNIKGLSKGWHYIYRFPKFFAEDSKYHKKFYKYETKLLTEVEMDSILKSWNLQRLNY